MKKIKKFLASLMVAVMVLTAAPLSGFVGMKLNLDWLSFDWLDFNTKASAASYSGTCGDNLTWSLDTGTGELVISGTGEMTDYSTKYSNGSFITTAPWGSYVSSIRSVTIQNGATSIGYCAFYDCDSLTSITIPDSVTSIGHSAFYYCTSLTSVTIPDRVTSIGYSAFYNCTSLTSITIHDGVTSIGTDAFYNCTSLTSITIPDSVTSIGSYAFYNTGYYNDSSNWEDDVLYIGNHLIKAKTSLSGAYTIKEGTKCIGTYAFYGCESLESITVPDSVTSINFGAFQNCTSLESVTIPDGVTSIDNQTFLGCTGLTSITIPDSVTSIGINAFYNTGYYNNSSNWEDDVLYIGNHLIEANISISDAYTIKEGTKCIAGSAFYNCTSLTSITIPDSVTSIGSSAFSKCKSLASITIPDSVTSIGSSAFSDCKSLTSITVVDDNTAYSSDEYGVLFNKDKTSLVQYPSGNKRTSYTIPDSVTSIGSSAFYGCTNLTSITIPDSVTSIGYSAFYGCTNLTSITIPDSVTSIGDFAFSDCTSLTDVYYTGTQEQWNSIAIGSSNDPLTSATIHFIQTGKCGDNLTWSFDTSTGELIISGTGAMKGYSEQYINGSYITTVPWSSYVPSIRSVTIKNGVTSIGDYAFSYCDSLTSVTISDSVTSIGDNAFCECSALENLYYTGDVASWCAISFDFFDSNPMRYADNVYFNGEFITELVIPDSVTSIGDCAFYNCTGLTSVTVGNSVTRIGEMAFVGCSELTSIIIGNSVTSIEYSAFSGCTSLTSITIPDSVTSIVDYAFSYCDNLTSITIPDSVTNIGADAFYNTGYYNNTCNWEGDVLYINNHLVAAKSSITGSYNIKSGTKTIAGSAFQNCTGLTSITIPDSVTSIGFSAFWDCTSLTSVTIPDSVTSIDADAFYNTGYYNNSSNWKDDVLYIGNHLIEAKTSLSGAYTIKEGTKCIADSAFYKCNSLTSITIPDSVTSIGYRAFCDCTSLTSITIPDGVTSIGNSMFSSCRSLTSITIPDSVTSIGIYAFSGCTSLANVHYIGTQTQWNGISKGSYNEPLTKADIHFCEKREGTPATCENDGYTEGVYCSVCDKYVLDHEEIPALGHDYQETVEQSSCTVSGLKYKKCSRCESVIDRETVPALGHNPEYFKVDPTCKEAGYECYKCTNCGTEYMREELDVIDHIAGDWETVKSATCSEDGYKIRNCTMCGEETHRETIPATGHSYEESIVTEPTCEGVGTKRFTCSVCGDSYDEEIAANGHKIKVIRKDPTCTSIGNEQYLCETCGNMIGDMVFLPKLPHAYGEWTAVKAPTATEDGSKEHSCTACGKTESVAIPAIGFETADGVTVDLEKNIISGFNAGVSSLDSYTTIVNENYVWEYEAANGKLGTGSKAILKDGDTVIGEYTILVYGDTTGDSWYDGQDAIIVDCIANGMLTKDDVSEAVYTAADCNHDGVIDGLDVALLNEAGTLLANVDQSKPTEVLLETSAEYVEYLDLIDQSPEFDVEDETDTPEVDVEDTPEADTEDAKVDIFEMILNFIKSIFEMILSYIPVPYK